ncbi:MAG: nuclear transport factor 2 family protein [Sphingomonadales bacterium]|nr:nuclear transport factor 2 family protein [Sphingomonadales bacterium]
MQDAKLKAYLAGWAEVSNSTPETVALMIAGAHPDIRFSDVNSPNVHAGHEGIRTICRLASAIHPGAAIAWDALLCDGRNWSIRWTMTRAMEDGTTFHRRGASAGSLAEDGRVFEHTDYWSKAG